MVIIGIHSTSDAMASLYKLLVNDSELKELMKIGTITVDNPLSNYFQQTYVSSEILTKPICSLLIRTAPKSPTNNEFVMKNSVIIEIYVHDSLEYSGIGGFKRRSLLIQDKLIKLLHRQYIGSDLYKFIDGNELQSSTPNFKRQYVLFQYKAVYA